MWFDILKNAKTVAQTQGGFDFEEEEIPEEDEQDDCKKWLKGLYDIMNKYQDIDYGHPYAYKKGPSQNVIKLDKIPENVACAIKDFYTETSDVYEIDTNITDIQPFFDKHGVDKEQFSHQDVYINTYFADYFGVDITLGGEKEIVLHAGPSFSWKWDDGPFKEMWDKIENHQSKIAPASEEVDKEVEKFLSGEHKESKRICDFIKEFSEYINKPALKEYFINFYAFAWEMLDKGNYNAQGLDSEFNLRYDEPDRFENALKQKYF
tara:strand:+ start:972 stop:1763 length:792 start_codon:yes stop_codon:yes gene_type:complete